MSPRGVAMPNVREALFAAAERVLLREGPGGLTGRSVTREAGCASGLLYSHFPDFDQFLTELVIDRTATAQRGLADLGNRVGEGTVTGNLAAVAAALGSRFPAYASLVAARPGLMERLHGTGGGTEPAVGSVEGAIAAYLDAERERVVSTPVPTPGPWPQRWSGPSTTSS